MIYINDQEAFTLAITYGFLPPWLSIPASAKVLDRGKCEPDDHPENEVRWFLLAQPIDHTKILFLYDSPDLPP